MARNDQSKRAGARARVALRAERAFGLDAVAVPKGFNRKTAQGRTQAAAVPQPVARRAEPVAAVPTRAPALVSQPQVGPAVAISLPLSQPFTSPPLSSDDKLKRLTAMNATEVGVCKKCRLCETRTNTVFGEGDHNAKIFFIGEGPGENEDLTGRPFVGKAGQLLDKMIAAMGLKREQVFIANIVKCRPPGNRVPAPDEVATCTPYLERQLELVRPQVIVTLGLPSAKYMLQTNSTMGRLRGNWYSWRGIKLMPTFHPAYILRSYTPETRAAVWSDLKQVMVEVGLEEPKKSS